MSRRTYATAVAAISLAAVLAGCGGGDSGSVATTTSTASPSSSMSSAAAISSSSTTTTTSATAGLSACATSQLAGSITPGGGGAAGHIGVNVTLTNIGSASCTLTGWPGVSFVGHHNGTQIGAPAQRTSTTEAPVITLQPNASASAPLEVTNSANIGGCTSVDVDGFRVYPPDQTDSLYVADTRFTTCDQPDRSLLQVKPFGTQ